MSIDSRGGERKGVYTERLRDAAARWQVPRTAAKPGVIIEIRGRVDALVGKIVDHRGQALVEDGGRDQRRAPAARGDGRRAGGGRDRVAARGHRASKNARACRSRRG